MCVTTPLYSFTFTPKQIIWKLGSCTRTELGFAPSHCTTLHEVTSPWRDSIVARWPTVISIVVGVSEGKETSLPFTCVLVLVRNKGVLTDPRTIQHNNTPLPQSRKKCWKGGKRAYPHSFLNIFLSLPHARIHCISDDDDEEICVVGKLKWG